MPSALDTGFVSPALAPAGNGAGEAFEIKFRIDEDQARDVERWARRWLQLDPHGEVALGGAYRTTSLYCDTPELDVYRRTESYRGEKFRLRRYGSSPWVFLEQKSRLEERVRKRRTAIDEAELPVLDAPLAPPPWPGAWFHGELRVKRLRPACRLVYHRTAFAGQGADGPMRLTLDRGLRGILTSDWRLDDSEAGPPLLPAGVILELKFRVTLPDPFAGLCRDMNLGASAVSKYRLCRELWGTEAKNLAVR